MPENCPQYRTVREPNYFKSPWGQSMTPDKLSQSNTRSADGQLPALLGEVIAGNKAGQVFGWNENGGSALCLLLLELFALARRAYYLCNERLFSLSPGLLPSSELRPG